MASSISLKRLATQNLLKNFLHHPIRRTAVAPSAARSFNTNAQMHDYNNDDRSIAIDRRSDQSVSRRRDFPPSLFPDVFDPFSSTRSLSQVLNLMNQFMENPFVSGSRGMGGGSRRGWDAK